MSEANLYETAKPIAPANTTYPIVPLGKVLRLVERFEPRNELEVYQFAGTYSFARGIFVGELKPGSSFRLEKIQRVYKGDFVYCKIMAWEGAFGIVPEEAHHCVMSGAFVVYEIDQNQVEPLYLDYYFKLKSVWESIGSSSTGTNIRRRSLHPKQFEAATMPLPQIAEQRRIVARVEELAGKVEEARGLRSVAIQKVGAFVSSLHLHLAQSRVVRLGEVLALDEQQDEVQLGQQYPQVGVKGFGGGLFAREILDATQTTYRAFNRLYEGAVVLSQVKGWEGAIAGCPKNLVGKFVSPEYRTFRCQPDQALSEYMAALVITPWFWIKLKDLTRGVGGRRERIRPEQFLKMEIPMPTVTQQEYAITSIDKLDGLKQLQSDTEKELNALLPSILDKAFKGEL